MNFIMVFICVFEQWMKTRNIAFVSSNIEIDYKNENYDCLLYQIDSETGDLFEEINNEIGELAPVTIRR